MKKIAFIALAVAVIAGYSGMVYAWDNHHMNRGYYNNMNQEDQQKYQELQAEHFKQVNPLRQQLFARQSELKSLYLNNPNPDQAQVQSMTKEIADLQARLYAAQAEFQAQTGQHGPMMGYGGGYRGGYGHRGGHGNWGGCGN